MVNFTTLIIIVIIMLLIWLPQAISQLLTWTYWWQVKEYRLDRFWVFLLTKEGRGKLHIAEIAAKLSVLLLAIFFPWISIFPTALFYFFLFLDVKILFDVFRRRIKKPVVTQRVERIWITCLIGIAISILLMFLTFEIFFALLLGEILLLLAPYAGILITIPIVNKIKKEEILKAKDVLKKVKPVVIGVTGSYGKTTTKEFITKLLSQRFKTAKTEGSENTEFGIARKTQKNVSSGTRYFVVEMGAYKIGEIAKLASIVSPRVGVITGIEPQHLSLFGSLENIKRAKYELIQSLPSEGIAIFNLSNTNCRELYDWAKAEKKKLNVFSYYLKKEHEKVPEEVDFYSEVISVDNGTIKFRITFKKENKIFFASLPGAFFVENASCAILISRLMGLSWKEIEKGVKSLRVPENTMKIINFNDNITVIDDTHNSTPIAFSSAIDYLSGLGAKNKFVVTSGIIELGDETDKVHMELGRKMSKTVDAIYLTNRDYYESISKGLGKNSDNLVMLGSDYQKLITHIWKPDSVFLLEGRVPSRITDYIKSKNE